MLQEANIVSAVELADTEENWPVRFDQLNSRDAARWFGCNKNGNQWWLGFFVGVQRWPVGGRQIEVVPRFAEMDYAAMYGACANDPDVAQHLEETFYVWPEEPSVQVNLQTYPWFTDLLVQAFLTSLSGLCARHLRRGFTRTTENLSGSMKGRVRIADQIRHNLSKQRPDRVICEFGIFDHNTRENRILRSALDISALHLAKSRNQAAYPAAQRSISFCRASLSGVPSCRVHPRDFALARKSGGFAAYAGPLKLAEAVLRHLGLDPNSSEKPRLNGQVPPFALCTFELFERFCEVKLRSIYKKEIWAGYRNDNIGEGDLRVRPDFLATRRSIIFDAKYKRWRNWNDEAVRLDVYKSIAYACHNGVRSKLNNTVSKVVFLYPKTGSDENLTQDLSNNSFAYPLEAWLIDCSGVNSDSYYNDYAAPLEYRGHENI